MHTLVELADLTSTVFSAATFRKSSIVGCLTELGRAHASSRSTTSVRHDSVDFPNPILTCIQRAGDPTLPFVWIRDE